MSGPRQSIPKSAFANADARIRCITAECWGDLMLMPTGAQDVEGFPAYQPFTACPLCLSSFSLDDDISDRDLFLTIAWRRSNPDAMPDESGECSPG